MPLAIAHLVFHTILEGLVNMVEKGHITTRALPCIVAGLRYCSVHKHLGQYDKR